MSLSMGSGVSSFSPLSLTFKCRAVAAVALGDPDKIEQVPVTVVDRFTYLLERKIDVLARFDYYTLERQVFEVRDIIHSCDLS